MENILENKLNQQPSPEARSRRSALMLGGAALAGMALGSKAFAQSSGVTDNDILNFALNLEFLEAQFYTLAVTGTTIDQAGLSIKSGGGAAGGTVTVKANPKVAFTTTLLQQFAAEVASDEQNHVKFLQSALGANAVAMPNIDLMNSFNALASAAGLGSTFDPFANETNFLIGAFIFEDVGVTAYQGAAGLITNKTYLDKAVGIHNVEAYHAASIRTRIFQAGSTAQTISQSIAATRAKLDGTNNDDIGVGVNGSASTIVDCDSNGMTYARTTTQVLSIVYGGGAAGKGGAFFPAAMNGTVK
ncbi:ferritin-like domain-containing protein [Terriglobus roseus]|uniref:Ferritin-like domain-containing protein n=1 Tax=Terriglobus roseus TaxID=392734 RepID=A0A1G7G2F8_9BACT|nr:ferritin-like domain-containing protein [Terriglobus roseus]SDE82331.1 Ferritin-like domain-containing protein [Terriglobus roseus]